MDDFDPAEPAGNNNEDDMTSTNDAELMKLAWRDEKAAPEILAYKDDLLARVMEQVAFQEDLIQDSETDPNLETAVTLYKLDVDRMKFLMRSYLRTRLDKIEKHAVYIAGSDAVARLSTKETKFLEKYVDMLEQYMNRSVLSHLPETYDNLLQQYEAEGKPADMIPKPDLDSFVFCRAKERVGNIQVDNNGDEIIDLSPGDLYIVRYQPIRKLLETGQIELV